MRKNKYESNLYYEEICRKNYKFKTFITIKVNFVINFKKKFEKNGSEEVDWAASKCLFTGAIPLLLNAGTFACCVSTLGQSAPL